MNRYYKLSAYIRERFGAPVRKLPLYAGFTCPNRDGKLSTAGCTFCDAASYAPEVLAPRPLDVQLREGIARGRRRGLGKFWAYFQPYSNTYAPLPVLRAAYDAIRDFPEVVVLSVGTRPDCVDEDVLALLNEYTRDYEVWVEYGLQSIHDRTLAKLNRGHDAQAFLHAVALTRRHPELKICAHVILGLPGETAAEEAFTAETLARLRIEGVKLHPLYVVQGTALAAATAAGDYVPLTREAYAERAAAFLERLRPETVVHRLSADCPAARLVAPAWVLDKPAVVAAIETRLTELDSRQGRSWAAV